MWDKRVVGQSVTLQAQPVLLAEGQAVPRRCEVDLRLRPEHARAAVARRPDPGRRVPALQLDQEAAEHAGREDVPLPVDADRLPGDERVLRAARRRPRPPRDLVRDRPRGDREGGPLRLRQAGQLVHAAAGAVLRPELAGHPVQPGEGEGRAREVEVQGRLQRRDARRRRSARTRTRSPRSSSRR